MAQHRAGHRPRGEENRRRSVTLTRVSLSQPDRRFIIGRSAGCCNKCRIQVFRENEFAEKARLGDDAHIRAYSDDGPRGGENPVTGELNGRANIILLCKNCHSEIDQHPLKFTVSVLTAMREDHYAWADERLGHTQVRKPKFHYILYLNTPRVDMYAVANSLSLPQFDFGSANRFRDLGFEAGRVMASYTSILNSEDLYASQVAEVDDISGLEVGQYCFLEPMNFRTVAVKEGADLEAAWASDKSIIYRRFGDWTLICLIDPRWITTSTAGSTLRSGQAQLCGVFRINRTDPETRKAYASPLFIAQKG
ncbi:hypothetical protein [Brevundimonas sp.]|uniref:hypothetical protein n=1 Tax=Brevundimonas sp. TaxID=1871086 RepID=UPI001A35B2F6|nr:hypothetical protein [Brevundimonas sp.]MBJ7486666.1 hypothetical protein [Brevundimonas sp.]